MSVVFDPFTGQIIDTGNATGGGGEVNTASNVGGGTELFKQKTGTDLEFKTLVAGSNVSFIAGPALDTVTINAIGGGGGVPTGGTANQALTKIDATNYNTQWSTIDKTFVGLGNVDNTSDLNKPISTATQTALNAKVDNTQSIINALIFG